MQCVGSYLPLSLNPPGSTPPAYPPNFLFSPLFPPPFKRTKSSSCWPMTSRCGGSRGVWSVYQKGIRSLKRTGPSPRSHQVPIALQLVVGPPVHPLLHLSETACWNMCRSGVWCGSQASSGEVQPFAMAKSPVLGEEVFSLKERIGTTIISSCKCSLAWIIANGCKHYPQALAGSLHLSF